MNSFPIDISVAVDENLVVWPGSSRVQWTIQKSIAAGDTVNDTDFKASLHTGTHIDAPLHFIENGSPVDQIDLGKLIGEACVVELPGIKEITAKKLREHKIRKNVQRLLLKTDNSLLWKTSVGRFYEDFAALTPDAAQWLVKQGIKLVGIDYLSIQRFKDGPEVHEILLKAGVVILEGLNLLGVVPGRYHLICLPLKLMGVEAAQARAVLYPLDL